MKRGWLGLIMLVLAASCDDVTSPEDYVALVEDARSCSSDDQCLLAGGGPCTCQVPINGDNEEAITEAASQVECNEVQTTDCAEAHDNVRCQEGRCVSDQSP